MDVQKSQLGAFLAAFADMGNVSYACTVANVSRSMIYRLVEHDEQFAAAYRQAELASTEALEQEAYRRACKGTPRPVWQGKELMGHVQEYSDLLLIFLLKARRPDVYRERVDITTRDITVKVYDSALDLDRV